MSKQIATQSFEVEGLNAELFVKYSWDMIDGERDNAELIYMQLLVCGFPVNIKESDLNERQLNHIFKNLDYEA